jgi:hypothetical protein
MPAPSRATAPSPRTGTLVVIGLKGLDAEGLRARLGEVVAGAEQTAPSAAE